MESLSARHSHSHHTLVSDLPDHSNSHGENTVKEGKSNTPGKKRFTETSAPRSWGSVTSSMYEYMTNCFFLPCMGIWLIVFSFFFPTSLEVVFFVLYRRMLQTFHVYVMQFVKKTGSRGQGEGRVWSFSPCHRSLGRNLVLLTLVVSWGVLWYLMHLRSFCIVLRITVFS